MWDSLLKLSKSSILDALNIMYPYSDLLKLNQPGFFMDKNLIKNATQIINQKQNNLFFGTEYVQSIIDKNQNPQDCNNRNFLIVAPHLSGIGSMVHVFGACLSLAINLNRTLIYDPTITYKYSVGNFCKVKHFDCFFQPLSKCQPDNLSKIEHRIQRIKSFRKVRFIVPSLVKSLLEKSAIPRSLWYFYWRIQSSFYITRFNHQTSLYLQGLKEQFLINPKESYDVSIYIRHGDKYLEMGLVPTEKYLIPVKILYKIFKRKLRIFLGSEDSKAVKSFSQYIQQHKTLDPEDPEFVDFELSFFNFSNHKGYPQQFMNFTEIFAIIKESINCKFLVGTIGSNTNRLILELNIISNIYQPFPYFEVGQLNCITPAHCRFLHKQINFNW